MVLNFLDKLRKSVSVEDYKTIWDMAVADIRFNMINFNKKVTPKYFINICKRCQKTLNRCNGGIQ